MQRPSALYLIIYACACVSECFGATWACVRLFYSWVIAIKHSGREEGDSMPKLIKQSMHLWLTYTHRLVRSESVHYKDGVRCSTLLWACLRCDVNLYYKTEAERAAQAGEIDPVKEDLLVVWTHFFHLKICHPFTVVKAPIDVVLEIQIKQSYETEIWLNNTRKPFITIKATADGMLARLISVWTRFFYFIDWNYKS